MARILTIVDEPLANEIEAGLGTDGHDVARPARLSAPLAQGVRDLDLVILDLDLAEIEGIETVREIRRRSSVPLIAMSQAGEEPQVVSILDAGADDHVNKPVRLGELAARARAILRRSMPSETEAPVLRFGDLEVDRARRVVRRGGEPLALTPTEYSILVALVSHPGQLLTHKWLLQRVWGPSYQNESHYLREFMRSLRRKLGDDATAPRMIATERGVGYRWIAQLTGEEPVVEERQFGRRDQRATGAA